jgi:hypothetical protein
LPVSVGIVIDPDELEVGAPRLKRLTADTGESRNATKYPDNVIALIVRHMWRLKLQVCICGKWRPGWHGVHTPRSAVHMVGPREVPLTLKDIPFPTT